MINGIKHRVVRLEQRQPDPEVSAEMTARLERACRRADVRLSEPLTEEQRAELKGKNIGQMILLFRRWAHEREEPE